MVLLTNLTVLADKVWQAHARVRLIRKIFLACSSVYAVRISVALELCNISVYQYYSISIKVKYSVNIATFHFEANWDKQNSADDECIASSVTTGKLRSLAICRISQPRPHRNLWFKSRKTASEFCNSVSF